MTSDWNAYWAHHLADDRLRAKEVCPELPRSWSPVFALSDWFDSAPAWRRVLVVGCGISSEPAALARAGYEVVAIDVSTTAIEYVRQHPPTREQVASWFRFRRRGNRNDTIDLRDAIASLDTLPQGGSIHVARCDFRDFETEKLFDIVYSPWSWQCLEPDGRRELSRRAFGWTAPAGVCLLATQNLGRELSQELHREFRAAGFFCRNERLHDHYAAVSRQDLARLSRAEREQHHAQFSRRARSLVVEDDKRARARLKLGERMYDTRNASG